jgi:hypothetical protein
MVRRVRGVHTLSLIEIKKKLLMAQKGGADISELFNTSLWTGNNAARNISTGIDSGEGSLVWIKNRGQGVNNVLFDTVRGVNAALVSNDTAATSTIANSLTGFTSTGYSMGSNNFTNNGPWNYVGWQFRRAEKFFDIVQYAGNGVSGRTISHNLGIKPGMMIVKRTDFSSDWQVYHQSQDANKFGVLNSTANFSTSLGRWNGTEPTSSVFTVGAQAEVNAGFGTYIAYLFAHDPSPEGLIQCGSYVGNGSATGPVVNLGWRPQYLMIKAATTTGDWQIIDAQRGFTSANDAILLANTVGAETSANLVNPSATGFQLASTASNVNTNGQTYIYMVIREAI